MGHLPKLIEDLALILIAGAVTTIIFKKIKQPLVLGYIIAGFLVGPHFSLIPSIADESSVETWAEIGVIFLLFSLGLEFSFKKLMRVGGAASITAFVEIIFITTVGYFAARLMNWSVMDSLFLGGMLASSSTTIIIRAFEELGVKTRQFARIVFGVLVVEDIVVILLMVLLSTLAVSQQFQGTELLMTILKLLFFLAIWFIMGIFLLPTFLKRAKAQLDDETLLILAIGLCLGMVLLATQVGFSAELGAFIMGSILAETTSAEKVEHLIQPVKNLFGAVFFVSVGMMIDPNAILEYKWEVLLVTGITLVGKLFSTTLGAVLSGQPLRQSVQVGMSMAQIGEFAFIVAALGLSLGVISDFLFPVAVGASAITTFTTPYMIRFSDPIYNRLVKILPKSLVAAIDRYSSSTQQIKGQSNWKIVIQSYFSIVLTNGIILLGILLISRNFMMPFLAEYVQNPITANILGMVIPLLVGSPFIWALVAKKQTSIAYKELWVERKYNQGPLLAIEIGRYIIGLLILVFWINSFVSTVVALLVTLPITAAILYFFSRSIQKFYQRMESRFLTNLHERDIALAEADALEAGMKRKKEKLHNALKPWTADIIDLTVDPHAQYVGTPLIQLAWREKYGINIVYIKRGDGLILGPGGQHRLLPFDRVGIVATDEQMQVFKPVFDAKESINTTARVDDVALQTIVVDEFNKLKGKSIRNSGIREQTNGIILGLERGDERILNPDPATVFEWDDVIWIVGDRKKIQLLRPVSGKPQEVKAENQPG